MARCCAPLSDQGRIWPNGEAFDGELHVDGFSLEGAGNENPSRMPLASLFKHLPVAVLKAGYVGAAKPAAKGNRQFA